MSTSHEQAGAVFYVVSRSGKVLGSEDHARGFVEGDYFEEELEGWIFWGSKKRSTGSHGSKRRQDATASAIASRRKASIGNSFDMLGRVSWKTRIPFVVWGNETECLNDVFSPSSWKQARAHERRINMRRGSTEGRTTVRPGEDVDTLCESPWPGSDQPQVLLRSEHWERMEQNLKIGFGQLAILRKWEPGSRELAARWAAWLLKILRKTGPRPLQHLLFTMCSAVLPVISYSLVQQQWTTVLDHELYRCADIVWNALEKSNACFSPAQWEILEERLIECRKLRMKVGGLADKYRKQAVPTRSLESSGSLTTAKHRESQLSMSSCCKTRDEQFSVTLLQSEGVSALVQRALHNKLVTLRSKHLLEGKDAAGVFGTSGTIVSLICPLSGKRVKVPARARGCSHAASFDLRTYLEGHSKIDLHRCNSIHQHKKPKTGTEGWCCPICGSDATWPQLIVDRLLLRILEVLPEHMSQVCLLPNGRWQVVRTEGGEDPRKIKSMKVAVHPPFESAVSSEIYHIGLFGELRLDAGKSVVGGFGQEESCGRGEVHFLNRAYAAWKDGVDHLAKASIADQIESQCGEQSTLAIWTGGQDQHSNSDTSGQASHQNILNLGQTGCSDRQDTDCVNSTKAKPEFLAHDEDVNNIAEPRPFCAKKIDVEDNELKRATASKLMSGSMPGVGGTGVGGMPSLGNRIGGMYSRKQAGQNKARHKLMAKKT